VDIANVSPNIGGVMLSCGNVGKLARITALVDNSSFKTLAGFIDFLLPSVSAGSGGCISPLPNIVPKFCMKLWRATQCLEKAADFEEAKKLQGLASLGEEAALRTGLVGLKMMLSQEFGYPAAPRLPLLLANDAVTYLFEDVHLKNLLDLEKEL